MKKIKWIFSFIVFLSFMWLLLMNNITISLDYGFGTVRASLLVTLLATYILGAVTAAIPLFIYCIRYLRKNRSHTEPSHTMYEP